jgi:CRISPR-associated protein Csd1
MILQALCEYYDVLDAAGRAPKFGWTFGAAKYGLVLGGNLSLLDLSDGKKKTEVIVPYGEHDNSVSPLFIHDNASYFFGRSKLTNDKKSGKTTGKKGDIVSEDKKFQASKELHLRLLQESNDPDARVVCKFFNEWNFDFSAISGWTDEVLESGTIVFLNANHQFIHDNTAVKQVWNKHILQQFDGKKQVCLLSGNDETIARLHPQIKGVKDANSSGANIVNFNMPAFESYGKKQGDNSPIGELAAFKYGAALNYLLGFDSKQKMTIGDTTIAFWAIDINSGYSDSIMALLGAVGKEDGENHAQTQLLSDVLKAVKTGTKINADFDDERGFCILGLSPNAARISIRFFLRDSFGNFVRNLARFFADMEIIGGMPRPLWQIIKYLSTNNDSKSKSSLLAGKILDSILSGAKYPMQLYTVALQRLRVPKSSAKPESDDLIKNEICTMIAKAYLIKNKKKEVSVALDKENKNPAYLLGRLFALLESAQWQKMGDVNAGIKDRYFSAAMTTPANVFPTLMRMNSKYDNKPYMDKEIREVISGISEFPARLDIDSQGMFAIGYYHQRQENFAKKGEAND